MYLSPKTEKMCFVINTKQKRWKPTCYKLLKFSCVLFLNYLNHTYHTISFVSAMILYLLLKSVVTANKVFVLRTERYFRTLRRMSNACYGDFHVYLLRMLIDKDTHFTTCILYVEDEHFWFGFLTFSFALLYNIWNLFPHPLLEHSQNKPKHQLPFLMDNIFHISMRWWP